MSFGRPGPAEWPVKPVDPAHCQVADTIADWKKTPGAVSIRLTMAAGRLGHVGTDWTLAVAFLTYKEGWRRSG